MAGRFDLNDYVEVAERIRAFYEKYPAGSIQTEMVKLEGDLVIFRAAAFRDAEDPHPTTGWAYERQGSSPVNKTSFVENCETSAVGRALANLSFAGTRRPSREEMHKVMRMREEEATPAARVATAPVAAAPTVAEDGQAAATRIRELLRSLKLAPTKRQRIQAKLDAGLTDQEAHDLEAYLLALRAQA